MNNYNIAILRHVFTCKCGSPLLMFGCDNPSCSNYYKKRLAEQAIAKAKEV